MTECPECGGLAEVKDRFVLPSTEGGVEHVKLTCVRGHWLTCPVETVARARAA